MSYIKPAALHDIRPKLGPHDQLGFGSSVGLHLSDQVISEVYFLSVFFKA